MYSIDSKFEVVSSYIPKLILYNTEWYSFDSMLYGHKLPKKCLHVLLISNNTSNTFNFMTQYLIT